MVASRRKTILVVDDDTTLLLALEKRLSHAGFQVLTAANGVAALQHARQQPIDAITLDIRLPDMDGIEIAAVLHKDPKTKKVPVIFVTAAPIDRHFRETCRALGVRFFIKKPCDKNLLITTLKNICPRQEVSEPEDAPSISHASLDRTAIHPSEN